jgi:acyl-coenzyme A synthetase/AMP-(fatty) acid ligase/3-hydroxymyristoyl/3-hydroxydecanoyl-(acyl carrier protein) dehydratase
MADLMPLSQWLVEQPDTVVAVRAGEEVSAQEFASRVQGWMNTLGQQPGHRWAVYHSDSCEFLAILLALWQLQRIACISSDNKPGTVARLANNVDGFIGDFPSAATVVAEPESKALSSESWIVLKPDFVALEICTSGSSGDPKSILKTIAQLEQEIEVLETLWPSESASVVLATVSHQHLYGMIFALFWPFSSMRAFESKLCEFPEDIIYRAEHYSRFSLVSSPSHLTRFSPSFDWKAVVSRCISVVSSAAPLARDDSIVVGKLLDTQVREIYGSTETGAIAWRSQQVNQYDAPWRALPEVILTPTQDGTLSVKSAYLGEVESLVLPDKVEFDDLGYFKLMGRVDRIVKVEGKRISLASIERLLLDHNWVKEVKAITIQGIRIETAIVMQLSDEGQAYLHQSGRKTLIKNFKELLAEHLESVVLPRRWRFVEQMPFNQQGKLPLENLQSLFEKEETRLPQIIDQHLVDGQLTLHCYIPSQLIYFDGHMEGRPILPGIVQLHWAEYFGRQLLPVSGRFKCLEVVKFQKVILPHYEVKLSLKFNEATGKLSFCYESDRGVHSRGRICFAQ